MVACGCDRHWVERLVRRHPWHDLDDFFCRGRRGQRDYWKSLPIATVGVPPQMPEGQMRAQLSPRGSVSREGEAPAIVGNALQGAAGHGRGGGYQGGAPKAAPRQPKLAPKPMAKKQAQQGSRVVAASAPGAAGQVVASKLILRARTTIDSTVSRSTTNHSHSSVTIA